MTFPADRLGTALADRYRIERELGAGGMATVYLADDLKHDRKVAIKVLKPELAAVLGAERFVVEIKTTAAMSHPHILPLFDSGTADGFLFYVMPYIQGETIREKLNRETQFGVDEAVRIAREVADALDYAHRHGVIHRDIKPENLLLHDGRAMVMDFGIALAVSAAAGGRMTETGLSLGTPHYMSPEQATAEKEITGRSDIYSLASVLYEMLAGQPPHVGGAAQQIIMKIITEQAQPVTALRKSVPPNVAAALDKALEKLPADRFENARAFADALGTAAFRGAALSGAGGTVASRGGSAWMRVAVGVAALASGIGIGAALMYRAPVPPPVIRFPVQLTSGQRLALLGNGDTPFALSPDGTQIAYVAPDSGTSVSTLHVRSLDQFAGTSLPGTEGATSPFFSPDGRWVGFIRASDATIRKVAASGGPVSEIATLVASGRGAPSWSDDHTIIYAAAGRQVLARVPDDGGESTSIMDSTSVSLTLSPFVLPGARVVLATVCNDRGASDTCVGGVEAIDLKTGRRKVLVPNARRGWYLPSGHLLYSTSEGAVFAVRFDPKSLTVTGAPVLVLEGANVGFATLAQLVVATSGTMAYLPRGSSGNATIVQVDRSGREKVIVAAPGQYRLPRLSPDERQIALGMDAKQVPQVWIHDVASATTRQLTFDGGNERASWSPDGSRVAVTTHRGPRSTIWSLPADGSGKGEPVLDGFQLSGSAAVFWTHDGKWIVWDGLVTGENGAGLDDIYAIPMSGAERKLQSAVATQAQEQSGEVSPDGKWIAYVSNDAGKEQVYIQPFLAPGGRTLVSAGGAAEPAWASNNELVYVNTEADSVMSARFEFGATIKVTRTALLDRRPYLPGLSAYRGYDVSRDGKTFVFVKPARRASAIEPIVVLNWAEEVKRLMATAGIR